MKNFIKSIKWKIFIKYEVILISILLLLYFYSPNKFPHNFYSVIIIVVCWTIMVLLSAYSKYLLIKSKNND